MPAKLEARTQGVFKCHVWRDRSSRSESPKNMITEEFTETQIVETNWSRSCHQSRTVLTCHAPLKLIARPLRNLSPSLLSPDRGPLLSAGPSSVLWVDQDQGTDTNLTAQKQSKPENTAN
eukprot:1892537-Rhodomonas_salina.2